MQIAQCSKAAAKGRQHGTHHATQGAKIFSTHSPPRSRSGCIQMSLVSFLVATLHLAALTFRFKDVSSLVCAQANWSPGLGRKVSIAGYLRDERVANQYSTHTFKCLIGSPGAIVTTTPGSTQRNKLQLTSADVFGISLPSLLTLALSTGLGPVWCNHACASVYSECCQDLVQQKANCCQMPCRFPERLACSLQWQTDFASVAQPWLEHALHNWQAINVKHKDDHLDQALLYKDAELEVLLHCFDAGGIHSYVHNHKASFVGLCLSGSYIESKWAVDATLPGCYIEYRRCAELVPDSCAAAFFAQICWSLSLHQTC